MGSFTALTAFALSPGWWIVIGVAVLMLAAIAANNSRRGSGISSRRYRSRTRTDS